MFTHKYLQLSLEINKMGSSIQWRGLSSRLCSQVSSWRCFLFLGQTNSLAVFAVACSFRSISTNTKPLGGTYATHFELVVPSLNCVDGSWAVMIEVIPQVEVSFHPDLRHIIIIKLLQGRCCRSCHLRPGTTIFISQVTGNQRELELHRSNLTNWWKFSLFLNSVIKPQGLSPF